MSESQWRRCAYELCAREELIEVRRGHRHKRFHDAICRQAQHRLLEQRARQAVLRSLWADYAPATQQMLEDLAQQHGEQWARRVCSALAHEYDQAQGPRQPALDLQDRAQVERQFMAMGQLLGYRALDAFGVGAGVQRWEDYRSWTYEATLAEVLLAGQDLLAEEESARMRAQEKSRLRQVERQLAEAQKRVGELELAREAGHGSLLADPQQIEVQLTKDLNTVHINVANPELYQTLYGQALLLVKEREREVQHLKTRISKQLERRLAKQQARIEELERQIEAGSSLVEQQTGQDDPEERRLAHELAKDLLRPYVVRGDTPEEITDGRMGWGCAEYCANIGPVMHLPDGKVRRYSRWQLVVSQMRGRACLEAFAVRELVAEIQREMQDEAHRQAKQAQFLGLGERLRYCALPASGVRPGLEVWQDFAGQATYAQLYEALTTAEHYYENLCYLDELEQRGRRTAQEKQQQQSRLHQVEQECQSLRERVRELEALVAERAALPPDSASPLTTIQAYLHTHAGGSIPVCRGKATFEISMVRDDGVAVATGRGLIDLSDDEVAQMCQWVAEKTGTDVVPSAGSHEVLALRQRVQVLEEERKEWLAWKEAEIVASGALTAMRQYLQDHEQAMIPIKRNGVTMQIWGIGEDALAFSEKHGLVRLNDEELEQARIWVCKQTGVPVIASRLPIGGEAPRTRRQGQSKREQAVGHD